MTSLNYHHLLPNLAPWLTLSGSNYPCLEQIFMVLKMLVVKGATTPYTTDVRAIEFQL